MTRTLRLAALPRITGLTAPSLRSNLCSNGVALIQLPSRAQKNLKRILKEIAPIRSAAAAVKAAGKDDGTSFGLQCLMQQKVLKSADGVSESSTPRIRSTLEQSNSLQFQMQCFGSVASVTDASSDVQALLGTPVEAAEEGAPQKLPGVDRSLKYLIQALSVDLRQILRTVLQRLGGKAVKERLWSHELLFNFYSQQDQKKASGPQLYSHTDLAALTLLLVPSQGGSYLQIGENGQLLNYQRSAFLTRMHIRASEKPRFSRTATSRSVSQHGIAAILIGKRLAELNGDIQAIPPTQHAVAPGSNRGWSAGDQQMPPRLSIAFFYCRSLEQTAA
eukprot:TRINITY_DN70452_c0_g1_i1.p1 TRINITY_DN70452_c0_g1~~TRINITY_DN70452_c0_g1_i1.p1  ORF type:complete len:333 (-),score=58.40 TRINITY_DN70452_c0_g1_i1:284-1282(-)